MQSSQRAYDFTVDQETGGKAYYNRYNTRPTWPGAESGVTVGIGYDLGQTPTATIRADWQGRVPDTVLGLMLSCSGIKGAAAKPLAAKMRPKFAITWEVANAVHEEKVWPRWEKRVAAALPNFNLLSPDCMGVLTGLCFNRGVSFNSSGDRYREMRAIKADMASQNFEDIPAQLRSMKRLWKGKGVDGLLKRRDAEADLFEEGLQADAAPVGFMPSTGDDRSETGQPIADLPDADPKVEKVQCELRRLNYWTVGEPDGKLSNSTEAAILAFRNDNGLPLTPTVDDELIATLATAQPKPVSAGRANATPKEVAAKNPSVLAAMRTRLVAVWGSIAGFFAMIFDAVTSYFHDAWDKLSPVRDMASSVPVWVWIIAALAITLTMAGLSHSAVTKATEDYNSGRLAA